MKSLSKTALITILFIVSCTSVPSGLEPITGFEVDRYLGKWYEIARLDHSFERNLSNVSARYTGREKGGIDVVNRGFNTQSEKWKEIRGKAFFIGKEDVGSLKVSFFGPFYGGYHVIALDKVNYHYAMIAGPSRKYLWILSRDKTLDEKIISDLVTKARDWGFDTDKLIYVPQNLTDG
jgi:apolipoprotein D and lipocalin family protein